MVGHLSPSGSHSAGYDGDVPPLRIAVAGRVMRRQVGGNSRYANALYEQLRAAGQEIDVLTPGTKIGERLGEALVYPRRRLQADVLHYPADTGALVPPRTPVVATVHGVAALHVEGVRSPRAQASWLRRTQRLIHLADHVITVSHSSKRDVVDAFDCDPDRVTVIPHGVDHDRFRPTHENAEDARALAPLGLPERFVLYVGNLEPRKNVEALVAASAEVQTRTGARLVVAGARAWDSDGVMAALTDNPHVQYLGRVPDELYVPLLRRASVFCFPSRYEGFGLPVLEAMACGTPVVCSDRGSLAEVSGDAARLLDDLSPEAVAEGLCTVLNDDELAADLAARGLVRAAKHRWSTAADEHLAVFRGVVARAAVS